MDGASIWWGAHRVSGDGWSGSQEPKTNLLLALLLLQEFSFLGDNLGLILEDKGQWESDKEGGGC
jgi:hypothetical protein